MTYISCCFLYISTFLIVICLIKGSEIRNSKIEKQKLNFNDGFPKLHELKKQRKGKSQPRYVVRSMKKIRKPKADVLKKRTATKQQKALARRKGRKGVYKKNKFSLRRRNTKLKKFKSVQRITKLTGKARRMLKKKTYEKKVAIQKNHHIAQTKLKNHVTQLLLFKHTTSIPKLSQNKQNAAAKNEMPYYEADYKPGPAVQEFLSRVADKERRAYDECYKTAPRILHDGSKMFHPGHVAMGIPDCRDEENAVHQRFLMNSQSTDEKKKQVWEDFQRQIDGDYGYKKPHECKQWRYGTDCVWKG